MTLSEMRRILDGRGWQLTRSLGQNFLHDANQVRRIVAAAALAPGDRVLEIGPGLGPLTEGLVEASGRVLAVEKDARMVEALRERLAGDLAEGRLEVVHADALAWLRACSWQGDGWKVASNLPYSVGSPILVELALATRGPSRMVVTLQEEVIDRLAARAGTEDYGVLTLLVGLRFQVQDVFRIPRDLLLPGARRRVGVRGAGATRCHGVGGGGRRGLRAPGEDGVRPTPQDAGKAGRGGLGAWPGRGGDARGGRGHERPRGGGDPRAIPGDGRAVGGVGADGMIRSDWATAAAQRPWRRRWVLRRGSDGVAARVGRGWAMECQQRSLA